jgi:hypothetical protein
MKVDIEVEVTRERLRARVLERDISYDIPNRIALTTEKRALIAALGDDAVETPDRRVVEGVGVTVFDPRITAGIVELLYLMMRSRLRPGWRGVLGVLDRVRVRVALEGYGSVPHADRRSFTKQLPYEPRTTWWIEGERIRY